jgi:hypothetical protein
MRHGQVAGVRLRGWADAQAAWAGARKPWVTQAQRGKVRKRLFWGASRKEIQRSVSSLSLSAPGPHARLLSVPPVSHPPALGVVVATRLSARRYEISLQ